MWIHTGCFVSATRPALAFGGRPKHVLFIFWAKQDLTVAPSVPWSRENRGPPIVLDLESKSPLYFKMPSLEIAAKRPKGCSSRRVFLKKGVFY